MRNLVLLALAVTVGANTMAAQVLSIPSAVQCTSCSFAWETIAVLGGADLEGASALLQVDSKGRFYLGSPRDNAVSVFDHDGMALHQFGRKGGAPGEIEVLGALLADDDGTVFVVDPALSRVSEFGPDGRYRRGMSVRTGGGVGRLAALMPNGDIVLSAYPFPEPGKPTKASSTLVRVHRSDGKVTPVLASPPADPRRPWLNAHAFWVRRSGELIAVGPYSKTIDVYSTTLAERRGFRRDAEWLSGPEPTKQPSDGLFEERFTPRINAVWEDDQGLVWTVTAVPSPLWTPRPPLAKLGNLNRAAISRLSNRPRTDTVIELLDLRQRVVVARTRIAGRIGAAFGGGYFARRDTTSAGEERVVITQVHLKRNGG